MIGLIVTILSCSKSDYDFSLLEPAFERCYISKQYINGVLYMEVEYVDEVNYKIARIHYYSNGVLRPDWTQNYEYEGDKLVKIQDNYNVYTYSYDAKGSLITFTDCEVGSSLCCTYNYHYEYDFHNLPLQVSISCTNGTTVNDVYEYTDLNTKSYYHIRNYSNRREVKYYLTFPNVVNPLEQLDPSGIENYQLNKMQDITEQKMREYFIDQHSMIGIYPTKITVQELNTPSLNVVKIDVYTYDYLGCK